MGTFAERIAGDVTRIARDVQSIADQLKAAGQTGGDLTPALDKLDATVDALDQLAGIASQPLPVVDTTAPDQNTGVPGSQSTLPASLLAPAPISSGAPGTTTVQETTSTKVTSIQVSPTSLTLKIGESSSIGVNLTNDAGENINSDKIPSFSSGDTSVATVDAGGIVTATGAGSTSISVSCDEQSASVSVSVST